MLCGLPPVQQAAISDCRSFDRFPFYQDVLAPPKIDVGGRQVADALVISQMIIIGDEGLDLGFEIAWSNAMPRFFNVVASRFFKRPFLSSDCRISALLRTSTQSPARNVILPCFASLQSGLEH